MNLFYYTEVLFNMLMLLNLILMLNFLLKNSGKADIPGKTTLFSFFKKGIDESI